MVRGCEKRWKGLQWFIQPVFNPGILKSAMCRPQFGGFVGLSKPKIMLSYLFVIFEHCSYWKTNLKIFCSTTLCAGVASQRVSSGFHSPFVGDARVCRADLTSAPGSRCCPLCQHQQELMWCQLPTLQSAWLPQTVCLVLVLRQKVYEVNCIGGK